MNKKVEMFLPILVDQVQLMAMLEQQGAQEVTVFAGMTSSGCKNWMVFFATPERVEGLIQIALKQGITQIQVSDVSTIQVRTQIASVALGSYQKRHYCRVTEHFLGNQFLSAEPDLHDLTLLSMKLGQSQDAVRADVMAAWRALREPHLEQVGAELC
jgi:hypothetical protein